LTLKGRAFERELAFLAARFRPGPALGLTLTAYLLVLVSLGWLFGGVTEDVVGRKELVRFDTPVAGFFIAHRKPWLTRIMEVVTWGGSFSVVAVLVVTAGLYAYRRTRSWHGLALTGLSLLGASTASRLVKLLVARDRPPGVRLIDALGYAFPSGHATAATAAWMSIALVLAGYTSRWRRRVAILAGALLPVLLVGVSRVYLGVHYPSDVLGGWALGGLWVTAVATALHVLAPAGPIEVRGPPPAEEEKQTGE